MPTYPPRMEFLPDLPLESRRSLAKDRLPNGQRAGERLASPAADAQSPRGQRARRLRSASRPGSWQRHMAESKKSVVLERYWHAFTAWCASRHLTWPSA